MINLWSGPRNVSTALMYSFARLPSVEVVDEPLYAHYLRVSGREHPGRDEVLQSQDSDGDSVIRQLEKRQARLAPSRLFLKQMAHHLVELDESFLSRSDNLLLVRDPEDMLPSLTIQVPDATLADTGLERQWRLYEQLRSLGQSPVVIDSRTLLKNPARVLEQVCLRIGLDYSPAMLHWPAGPRPEDGVWAKHWYHSVHRSTGFAPYREKGEFPERLEPLLGQCAPWYAKLRAVAVGAEDHEH